MKRVIMIPAENIDYPLLKLQKAHLYGVIVENQKLTEDQLEALDGIINLLDYITDKIEDREHNVRPVNHQ